MKEIKTLADVVSSLLCIRFFLSPEDTFSARCAMVTSARLRHYDVVLFFYNHRLKI
jgi:hypothetical protein